MSNFNGLYVILVECKADKRQSPLYLLICHQATKLLTRVHRQTAKLLVAKLVRVTVADKY